MKISVRIFLACLAVVALCLCYPLSRIADALSIHYREGVEDSLADQANILATLVEKEMQRGVFSTGQWREVFERVRGRALGAQIYGLHKETVDSGIYITDARGIVLFDSGEPGNIGKDFSRWRDVYHTLQGRYGARATRFDARDETSSTLHVAAPLYVDGAIAGVLTVVKPTTNIRYFESGARLSILESGAFSLAAAILLAFLAAAWITRPVKRLTLYARAVRDGRSPAFPRLDKSEVGEMGRAFAEMQETLEGKRYVEQYVEHLTHELKSPLAAIRGAAELLGEPMEEARQRLFLDNIRGQSLRIQEIVDRMLELAALESRSCLERKEKILVSELIRLVREDKQALFLARNVHLEVQASEGLYVLGDPFLLVQALANLVQNALDFSPERETVMLTAQAAGSNLYLAVCDRGPGIPAYARERIYDRFFSLPRPHSGRKSTGLGLNFVRRVALLHGGTLTIDNRPEGGVRALFALPLR